MESYPPAPSSCFPTLVTQPSSVRRQRKPSMSHTAFRSRRRPEYPPFPSALLLVGVVIGFLVSRASAVLVSTFENCLQEDARRSPTHLQFHPVLVAAEFDSVAGGENYIRLTVWGTVTGADEANPPGQRKRDLEALGGRGEEDSFWDGDIEVASPHNYLSRPIGVLDKRDVGLNGTDAVDAAHAAQPTYFGEHRTAGRWPSDDIFWNFTGAIVDHSDKWPSENGKVATTLATRIQVATIEAYYNKTFFCAEAEHPNTVGAICPFGNRVSAGNGSVEDRLAMKDMRLLKEEDRDDISLISRELPSFGLTRHLKSSYQFASLGITMKVIAGDAKATTVGCVHIEVTPKLSEANSGALTWAPVGVLVLVAITCIAATMTNPWSGTTDLFKWSSNFGMDEDMIRLVTPGFADCLQWIQFAVLTSALTLSYPGFYPAVMSKAAWSVLLLNNSFYSGHPNGVNMWVADGIYATQSWVYGYERLAQLVGLVDTNDMWVSVILWFGVLLVGAVVVFQIWFWGRWCLRRALKIEENDLNRRNWPFTVGLIFRFTFTYFLIPLLAACTFQLTVTNKSTTPVLVVAGVIILVIFSVLFWLTKFIWTFQPRSALFDELPHLLMFGTFYNTFREKSLKHFIVNTYTNVLRGVTFGALQPSGIAQITILAVCEIVTILTLHGLKPYPKTTSMNSWHIFFSIIRLITVLLMMAFIPSIGATDAVKGWTGWVILGIHGLVLIFLFVFKALQTLLELGLRGWREEEEASRGGLSKVFGLRQLSRRNRHSSKRSASLTPTPMTSSERKPTLTTLSSRHGPSHSNSSAILLSSPTGILIPEGSRSGHGHSNSGSTAAGFTPTSPGPIGYGQLPPHGIDTTGTVAGPYYRPPRTHRPTEGDNYSPAAVSQRHSWGSHVCAARHSQGSLPASGLANVDTPDGEWGEEASVAGGGRITDPERSGTDYAVREVDFYYGVRGPALSTQPARRLGTGPADPTGPISTAKSWVKQKLGLASGKQEKGFSVVRSSRAPEQILIAQREAAEAEAGAAGIGVAVSANPDTSSDDDEEPGPSSRMLNGGGDIELPSRKPTVPRKSSKRKSRDATPIGHVLYDPPIINRDSTGRLPFEEEEDEGRERSFSTTSSSVLEAPAGIDLNRPASVGAVRGGTVGNIVMNERGELTASQAELVRGGSGSSR